MTNSWIPGSPESSPPTAFLIPYGYQTHLMVDSPGRYSMGDFLRVGLPVSLTYSAAVLLLTPLVFPF